MDNLTAKNVDSFLKEGYVLKAYFKMPSGSPITKKFIVIGDTIEVLHVVLINTDPNPPQSRNYQIVISNEVYKWLDTPSHINCYEIITINRQEIKTWLLEHTFHALDKLDAELIKEIKRLAGLSSSNTPKQLKECNIKK